MKRGFTLLELVVVVIILGILATLGFTQYTKMVEKGRTAEAKMILGQLRTAEAAYNQQYGAYTSDILALAVNAEANCTQTTHYFSYSLNAGATTATATRCSTAGSGKTPALGAASYTVTLTFAGGDFGGTPGYF